MANEKNYVDYFMSAKGCIGMVLANGSLSSQSGGEGEIRRRLGAIGFEI